MSSGTSTIIEWPFVESWSRPRLRRNRLPGQKQCYDEKEKERFAAAVHAKSCMKQGIWPINRPCRCVLMFEYKTTIYKKLWTVKTTRPDLDNLIKFALDVAVDAGVIADDNVIFMISARKQWSRREHTTVTFDFGEEE